MADGLRDECVHRMTDPLVALRGPVHHFGLVVLDLEAAIDHVERTYGRQMLRMPARPFPCHHRGEPLDITVPLALSIDGPPHLELLEGIDATIWTPLSGLHHVGYVVADLPATAAALVEHGLPIEVADRSESGQPQRATYHRDPLGPLIELMAESTAAFFRERIASR